jgi:TolA-binding protein
MNRNNRHITNKSKKPSVNSTGNGFDDNMLFSKEDQSLFSEIGDSIRAQLDLDEVRNDPSLDSTRAAVNAMISDYKKTLTKNRKNEKFIRESILDFQPQAKINSEINEIKLDIGHSDINDITAEWVKEWHTKKQSEGAADSKSKEIRDFITGSLKAEDKIEVGTKIEAKPEVKTITKKRITRSLIIRYTSLSAAALIGVFILIRTLLPSSDPSKLFSSFYKPFDAISPVSRSLNSDINSTYSSAISSYKSGDYYKAAAGFSKAVVDDPSYGSPHFFLGLTAIALGNFDTAINQLTIVVKEPGEYGKEAIWYLGLAYLKEGNKQKASECFENLSKSPGFYRDRSEKILRRLK